VALQPDGKIVVAGTADTNRIGTWDYDFAVARLFSNGAPDVTFGTFGQVTHGMGGTDEARVIAIQPDGRILAGGFTQQGFNGENTRRFAIARYTFDGRLDKTWDHDGKVTVDFGAGSPLNDMIVAPDKTVVAVGAASGQFAVARFTEYGRPDASFAGMGKVLTGFGGNEAAYSARMTPEGKLLVAGGCSGQFAMAQYHANGSLDSGFGAGGKVVTDFAGNEAILRTELAPNGKIMAYGANSAGSINVARYARATPTVQVVKRDDSASEASNAAFGYAAVVRDRAYDFPTRVLITVGGNATHSQDYDSSLRDRRSIGNTVGGINSGSKGRGPGGGRLPGAGGIGGLGSGDVVLPLREKYIDIPAGKTSVPIIVNVRDDAAIEPVETVSFTLAASPDYSMGASKSASVNIADNEVVHVNFQKLVPAFAQGHATDVGAVFGDRGAGLSFGWDADNTANARVRVNSASPDFRYDTLNHMQKDGANRRWEIAVPNGMYDVRVVAGDPSNTDAMYRMDLEGKLALAGNPTGETRWFRSTVRVRVSDGRLTLSNGAGAVNNRICFLDIKSAPVGATAEGMVAGNLPVQLKTPATAGNWTQRPNGLFSDNQIDEPLWA
jgi:uncharacterized delta-60 repeat protein